MPSDPPSPPPPEGPRPPNWEGATRVYMAREELDGAMITALEQSLPPDTVFGFNYEGDQGYVIIEHPHDPQAFVAEARRRVGR